MRDNKYRVFLKSGNSFVCDMRDIKELKSRFNSAPDDTFLHSVNNEIPILGVKLSEIEAYILEPTKD